MLLCAVRYLHQTTHTHTRATNGKRTSVAHAAHAAHNYNPTPHHGHVHPGLNPHKHAAARNPNVVKQSAFDMWAKQDAFDMWQNTTPAYDPDAAWEARVRKGPHSELVYLDKG